MGGSGGAAGVRPVRRAAPSRVSSTSGTKALWVSGHAREYGQPGFGLVCCAARSKDQSSSKHYPISDSETRTKENVG